MISVQDIHKPFGALEVIKGMTFDVNKGEVVCIIGPSGSGKSTVLRCINGLETYNSGMISIDGQKVDATHRSITAIRTKVFDGIPALQSVSTPKRDRECDGRAGLCKRAEPDTGS